MDPLSQAVTGAALAGSFSKKATLRPALAIGALAGMAPDLDIFIRSTSDPLLALEYHRHFTHSMAFAPIGGLACALFFWLLPAIRKRLSFKQCYLFSFLGLFTHGFLDACTGYGTHLLWPFSNARESWNFIGIIDPLYTLPVLLLLIIGVFRASRDDAIAAMLWMLAYLGLGVWQHQRGLALTSQWLQAQNIPHERLTLRPTIGNLWLWRVLYHDKTTNRWQAHALHLPYWSSAAALKRGESATIFNEKMMQDYPENTVAGTDLRRFQFFSDYYLSRHDRPDGSFIIGDVRYSMTPDSTRPIWGIELPQNHDEHVRWHPSLRGKIDWDRVNHLLNGEGFVPLHQHHAQPPAR